MKARYGSAVASYFHFYRWLVGTYIFIASLSLVWIVFHILKLVNQRSSTIFSATLIGANLTVPHQPRFKSERIGCLSRVCVRISSTVRISRNDHIRYRIRCIGELVACFTCRLIDRP